MTEKSGTFLVTEANADSAVLSAVDDGQVHALSSNPGVEAGDVVEGTVAAEPPLEVTWTLVAVEDRRSVTVERRREAPSDRALSIVPETTGKLTREPTEDGERHVIAVEPGTEDQAATEVVEDRATRERAARLGATRVEVRAGDGLVSVRYEA